MGSPDGSVSEGSDLTDGIQQRRPHGLHPDDVSTWVDNTSDKIKPEDMHVDPEVSYDEYDAAKLPRLSDYENFIQSSRSYSWLICELNQHEKLSPMGSDAAISKIGSTIRDHFRAQMCSRKMSNRRPISGLQVDFVIPWSHSRSAWWKIPHSTSSSILDKLLCITGSKCEAQAMTVKAYMRQTWPTTEDVVTRLFERLLLLEDNRSCIRECS